MNNSQLKTKIELIFGTREELLKLPFSSMKAKRDAVNAYDEMIIQLLQLIQQTIESCLPEKEKYDTEYIKAINIIEYPGYEYNFVIGFNKCIDLMKSNFQAILEGKE